MDQDVTVQHKEASKFVNNSYSLIDSAIRAHGVGNPVRFNEEKHTALPFENSMQRFRFFYTMKLSVPVVILRLNCPGGSNITISCIAQVDELRNDSVMLTDGAKMCQKMKPLLKEYHTRAQKRDFKRKVANIAKIQPSVVKCFIKTN